MNARQKRQIAAELAAMRMQATDGPGQYVTVQIEGPDGPEVYKVWACAAEHTSRRHNPPLPEHMAHDSLDEIAESLAARFVRHPAGFIPFLRQLFFQVHMQVHHNVKPGSDLAELRSEARLLDNIARREFPYVSRADEPAR
jgi:hypothetical protein